MKISRRELFALSMGSAAGIAISSAACAPSSAFWAAGFQPRPWWVRSVNKPKMGIDDSVFGRFDSSKNVFGSFRKYYTDDFDDEKLKSLYEDSRELRKRYFEGEEPGFTLRDRALADAAWVLSRTGGLNRGLRSWRPNSPPSYKRYGVEPYTASPEEAAQTIKAAARYYGSALTGIAKLDRRHICSHENSRTEQGRKRLKYEIAFEDVDDPLRDDSLGTMVIPSKCEYAIAVSVQMSLQALQCSPSGIGSAASSLGYSRIEYVVGALAEFIRGLGYTAIPSINDLGSSVATAVDAGLGELGRTNRLVSPEYGPNLRLGKVLTDMPVEIDGPIDFGLKEFCMVCMKCAEQCPSGCLSKEDEPSFKTRGEWNNPGHEAWFEDAHLCLAYWTESTSGCSVCIGVCPFAKGDKTFIHEFVKAVSSSTPVFDGVFTAMDGAFGYGRRRNPADWWKTEMPEYGIDTTHGKRL